MHTAELDSAVWCTLQSLMRNWGHLTPWCDVHRGAWLSDMMHTEVLDSAVWCTPRSFLRIRIYQRNRNRIRKYFSMFIRGLDGFKSWKNGAQKSRNTLPLRRCPSRGLPTVRGGGSHCKYCTIKYYKSLVGCHSLILSSSIHFGFPAACTLHI